MSHPDADGTENHAPKPGDPDFVRYDARRLSYAGTFSDPSRVAIIRSIEWVTGKLPLLRRIRRFERMGTPMGQPFFHQALEVMGVEVRTPAEQIAKIPAEGPLVVVANHPHGLVDGLVMADLIGRVRTDYKILTRSLLTGIREIDPFMLPVPFPHEPDSHRQSIKMRNEAMDQLRAGGVIILFPAGAVASSETWFGPVKEKPWNPFTAKMVLKSGATVLPIYFPGRNTRLYQIADKISPSVRQGLLLHEIAKALDKPQSPIIGDPLTPQDLAPWQANTREFMDWMRTHTLALGGRTD
ncbi:lysophospholipid acyltransferase family protein [Celeribacter indicus]|uniref:Acyltransferase domain-containing protein n=1 Tax=Celeribacter indicus TaxID=1208324 RepID=A0A0B5DX57_9RHOB|nr:lysophospholipid acyltransferase family protein [Celeribacter indicus]AJE45336.1 acyltransferase domain-containing protein [Celeribacter indicus]SDX19671.1 Putative hemolysin [Celeribacter indicus]